MLKTPTTSLVPRPLPDFLPQLRDKIWEWPGSETIQQLNTIVNSTYNISSTQVHSVSEAAEYFEPDIMDIRLGEM